jgi:predicted metal-dependent peptidase
MKIEGGKTHDKYSSAHERWEWLVSSILLDDMFVHEILMIMDKKESSSVPTMGVCMKDSRIELVYNLKFLKSLTDAEVRYVLKHETLHVALHHITNRLSEDPKERELWNIAADLAINCLITETASCKAPHVKDPKTGEVVVNAQLPKNYGFPDKLSMEQYVQLLRERQQQDSKSGKSADPSGEGDEEGEGGGGDNKGEGDGEGSGGSSKGAGGKAILDDHSGWAESEIGDEQIRQKIEQMANSSQSWGTMSADCKEVILAAQKAKVPWTKILRHYLGNLVSGRRAPTFKRPNRRFGYPFSGTKKMYSDRKLVAIDTSGSVGSSALSQFLTEINKLAEVQPVDLALFDADITQEPKAFDKRHATYEFSGRGGTNFSPICKLASERKYQSLIILTDGDAPAPEYPDGVKDVIWVLTPDGKCPVDWGAAVTIDVIEGA